MLVSCASTRYLMTSIRTCGSYIDQGHKVIALTWWETPLTLAHKLGKLHTHVVVVPKISIADSRLKDMEISKFHHDSPVIHYYISSMLK